MYRNALLRKLGGEDEPIDDPWNPNPAMPKEPTAPASVVHQPTGFAPGEPDPNGPPPPVTPQAPAKAPGFSSQNTSGRGYLEEARDWFAPQLQQKRGAEAETAVQDFLRSLVPELKSRGMNVGDVRKEKMQIDGNWVDLYRDIGGESAPQWHVDDGSGGGAPRPQIGMGGMGAAIDPMLQGDPLDAIQQALARISGNSPHLSALLAQLGR